MIYGQNENLTVFTDFTVKIVLFLLTVCVRKSVMTKHMLVKPRVWLYGALSEGTEILSRPTYIFFENFLCLKKC